MTDINRSQSVASEAAILVGVLLPSRQTEEGPLEELAGLAETAGAHVVGEITQRREAPDVTTYLGRGKVEELKNKASSENADVVLFDNDLSPAQTRNLEQATGVKVLDRTELILDIFVSRARTSEARLAVELGPAAIRLAAAEADVDPLVAAQKWASACVVRAKSSWKPTADGPKSGSAICAKNCAASKLAKSGRSPRAPNG